MKFKFLSFLDKKKKALKMRGLPVSSLSIYAGLITALFVSGFYFFGAYHGVEARALDFWTRLRGPLATHSAVKIVGIDDISLNAFGRWPWPRSYHAALLEVLAPYKPKVVVFDMIFPEPTEKNPEEDQAFADAIRESGNVVLGSFMNPAESHPEVAPADPATKEVLKKNVLGVSGKRSKAWYQGTEPSLPVPVLLDAALGTAFVNATPDFDSKIREIPLVVSYDEDFYPSLSLKAIAEYWGLSREDFQFKSGAWLEFVKKDGKKVRVPVNERGNTKINYPGSFDVFPGFSFAQLMAAFYDEEDPNAKDIFEEFRDAIVLVGVTATGSTDLISTPFKALEPGIVMHAAILNNLIQGRFLYSIPHWLVLIIFLFVGWILGWAVPRVRPYLGGLLVAASLILYTVLNYLFFAIFWWVLPLFSVLTIMGVTYLFVVIIQFLGERVEKQILRQELTIAERIQKSFLPRRLPKMEGAVFAAETAMAKLVGGDLYDFINFNKSTIGVAIGDVSGKGVPASLYMAKSISDFRTYARAHKTPAKVLTELNQTLVQEGAMGMFVTFFYYVLDLEKGVCCYSSAGHHPLLKWEKKTGKITEHNTTKGRPLGILPFKDLDEGIVEVGEGDILLLYTDGIDEAMNKARQCFGKERILSVLRKNSGNSPKNLIIAIQKEVGFFVGKADQHDDMTLVAVQVGKRE